MSVELNSIIPFSPEIKGKRKRETLTNPRPLKNPKVIRDLFGDPLKTADPPDLQVHYGVNFENPTFSECPDVFWLLRDQLLALENTIAQKLRHLNPAPIRTYIKEIIETNELNLQQKMAELGSLLYFIERERFFPEDMEGSFFALHGHEIIEEIEKLKASYHDLLPQKKYEIPSGKTHYILRAFAQMVITEDQKVNIGALFAIQELLLTPSGIATNLTFEHRGQILAIVNNLISQPQCIHLLEKKVIAHSSMEDLIRLDMKLHPEKQITSVDVMRACIIALFFDLRQKAGPNCYAISALIYTAQNGTYKMLKRMIEWISTGHLIVDEAYKIPIFSFVDKYLILESDLTVTVDSAKALSLKPLENISEILGLDEDGAVSASKGQLPLHQALHNAFKKNTPFAKQLFCSYKQSALVAMMLALFQFNSANAKTRDTFFNDLIAPIQQITNPDFCAKIREKIREKIWFEDWTARGVHRHHRNLSFGPRDARMKIVDFKGDINELEQILKKCHRGVFLLENGVKKELPTISSLQSELQKIVMEAGAELATTEKFARRIAFFVSSNGYARQIADTCAAQIDSSGIHASDLLHADLLLFKQDGGKAASPMARLFDLKVNKKWWHSSTSYEFVERLHNTLKQIDPSVLQKTPLIMAGSTDHFFTLNTKRCDFFWKNNKAFPFFFSEAVLLKVHRFITQPLPADVLDSLIKRCSMQDCKKEKSMRHYFSKQKNLTYELCRELILKKYPLKTSGITQQIIDEEFSMVNLTIPNLQDLFKKMKLDVDLRTVILFRHQIALKFAKSKAFPFRLAKFLAKLLIKHNFPILDPYDLERSICEIKDLPTPFDIGDLNWTQDQRENSHHCRLILRYHFGCKTMRFFNRDKKREHVMEQRNYSYFDLFHPTTS